MRPRSVLSAREYRSAIAATNSSRVAMLTRLIPDPADEHRTGANQMRQWLSIQEHFRRGNAASHPVCRAAGDFAHDAAAGNLSAYSFIEPRYFTDTLLNKIPNDEHPPHNVAYGEELIAAVYNAVRGGPGWKNTLLVITYDEHGGCYDHVVPPPAAPPDGRTPDGFDFGYFGVRVPAVIVSPHIRPGSVVRPAGPAPFDHTSIIATLRQLFGFTPLTARDAAAPDLLGVLDAQITNDGPVSILAPAIPPAPEMVARAAAKPPNSLQKSLSTAAVQLPTAGANIGAHIQRLDRKSTRLNSS